MQVDVRFLDNLRLEARFDDYTIISDQPVRYKGDATAPGPFDYFLASSAMCAAYFVKLYCNARDIPTTDIRVTQQNLVDPDNRYHQDFNIQLEVPDTVSQKDRAGMIASMERCTVKRVIQNNPSFKIEAISLLADDIKLDYREYRPADYKTLIKGKECSLEETLMNMRSVISDLGIDIEIASWRNPIPHVWSVHVRDADSPMCYSNGKGSTKDSALCSALGEYLERLSTNYFYSDYFLGSEIADAEFVHYPQEKWFSLPEDDSLPSGILDQHLISLYDQEGELRATHLIDTNSGNTQRGICSLPYIRQSDNEEVFIPVNLIGNLFVSNGMAAGNTPLEAKVQALSEILERAIKNKIITEEISLPDVPRDILVNYPKIMEGIETLESKGFPIYVKDASLGGVYPVACVTLLNPNNGGVFASFGAHPDFEVAIGRSLTELLQGRSFEGMNDTSPPTFNTFAITEQNNIVDHFIDSTGVISWNFFNSRPDYEFVHWNLTATTQDEFTYLMQLFKNINKEVYIAEYNDLGVNACRILVPDFSEIYPSEDLVWDNNNKAIPFRNSILTINKLSESERKELVENLEESELDNYMTIEELIGVSFDESDAWGRLTLGELKGLLYLSLKSYEEAKEQIDLFLNFNDSTLERKKFYQLLGTLLDIELNEHKQESFEEVLKKMYGEELYKEAKGSIFENNYFYGLSQTNTQLHGLKKHLALVASYKKLQQKRGISN
jgi:ribosomal protein S12 methylthiotransferase accessory factor